MNGTEHQEQVLRNLLKRASQPTPPAGAEERLMQRVRASTLATRPQQLVVAGRPRTATWKGYAWAGLPLAASLLLGIVFGSSNAAFENYLPDSVVAWISPSSTLELDVPLTLDDSDVSDGSLA